MNALIKISYGDTATHTVSLELMASHSDTVCVPQCHCDLPLVNSLCVPQCHSNLPLVNSLCAAVSLRLAIS